MNRRSLLRSSTHDRGCIPIGRIESDDLPGTAEDCGVAGFAPTSEPRQNTVCTGSNDIVVFTPQFGADQLVLFDDRSWLFSRRESTWTWLLWPG